MNFFTGQSGGGSPAASWKSRGIGDGFQGVVETVSYVNKKLYNTDTDEVDPSTGQPVKQLRIIVQGAPDNYATAAKPLLDESTKQPLPDDGRRALYVSRDTNLSFAVARVLAELGLQDADPLVTLPGAQFAVQHVGEIPTTKGNPAKDHKVWITPAPPKDPNGFMAGQAQAAQQVQQPQAAPAQQFAQAPAPAQQFAPQQAQPQQAAPAQQQFAQQAPAQQQGFAPQAAAPQSNLPAFQQQAAQQGFAPQGAPVAQQGFAPQGAPQAAPSGFSDEPPF